MYNIIILLCERILKSEYVGYKDAPAKDNISRMKGKHEITTTFSVHTIKIKPMLFSIAYVIFNGYP